MKTKQLIAKTREYLDYLERHIDNYAKAWSLVQEKCSDQSFIWDDFKYAYLAAEVDEHDLSKLSAEEFTQYRDAFFPVDGEASKSIDAAWEHHKANNPHHWENWTATPPPAYGSELQCVLMVLDWMAMSMAFGNDPLEWYERNVSAGDVVLPDWADGFVRLILDRCKQEQP